MTRQFRFLEPNLHTRFPLYKMSHARSKSVTEMRQVFEGPAAPPNTPQISRTLSSRVDTCERIATPQLSRESPSSYGNASHCMAGKVRANKERAAASVFRDQPAHIDEHSVEGGRSLRVPSSKLMMSIGTQLNPFETINLNNPKRGLKQGSSLVLACVKTDRVADLDMISTKSLQAHKPMQTHVEAPVGMGQLVTRGMLQEATTELMSAIDPQELHHKVGPCA
jgi:hypothetical protein